MEAVGGEAARIRKGGEVSTGEVTFGTNGDETNKKAGQGEQAKVVVQNVSNEQLKLLGNGTPSEKLQLASEKSAGQLMQHQAPEAK